MQAAIANLLKHPGIWRGDGHTLQQAATLDCGHAALAAVLPGGGWPQAAVTELLARQSGCGELKLLLPALATLTRAGKQVLLIAPPHIPYAPAWQAAGVDLQRLTWVQPEGEHHALWAMEQSLREPACGAVVAWFRHALADRDCRRMQLAAETGGACGFVLRQGAGEPLASPFGLRLAVDAVAGGVAVQVLKRRGPPLTRPVFLSQDSLASQPAPRFSVVPAAASVAGTSTHRPQAPAYACAA
ncbi:translesion DNA synthesis-associated protein ImuA [Chitinimonas sp.]|uniref:translesion DNA synthesis-associated protein ImuA n=1 Tax=Chitinimonas sp. TaxID=1934313 RepID=UPI0035B27236